MPCVDFLRQQQINETRWEGELRLDKETVSIQIDLGSGFMPESAELRGRIASYTGFHSQIGFTMREAAKTLVQAVEDRAFALIASHLAQEHYNSAAALPYAVWKEHAADGWQMLSKDWETGALMVRLPLWASSAITDALGKVGMSCLDPYNGFWGFYRPSQVQVSRDSLKSLLAPILAARTRLQDEGVLASQILANCTEPGVLICEQQLDLFGQTG